MPIDSSSPARDTAQRVVDRVEERRRLAPEHRLEPGEALPGQPDVLDEDDLVAVRAAAVDVERLLGRETQRQPGASGVVAGLGAHGKDAGGRHLRAIRVAEADEAQHRRAFVGARDEGALAVHALQDALASPGPCR
ncbi:MAG TPA: hypothetical protein VMR43_11810 [Variovorax sp.]|nr:hypothetical protein [Variovorax sp.]